MSAIKRLIENILACDTCYGKGFTGWVSPDGDYDFEYCECNPHNLVLEGMELFLCDKCDTLATVEMRGDTLKITKCACLALEWKD